MAKIDKENSSSKGTVKLALAWLVVGLPLAWGVVETLKKAMALFGAA
ncbi:MAG TPA: oxalate:formate antiporter [Polyangia bacterium]|nr:oxalate:formate antiporter [Polyangia bacterium]